jgi:MFS family permease
LSPFQSGNAFITLGVIYFLASLQTARLVERFGKVVTLRLGCVVQMTGLLVLMLTLSRAWPQLGVLSLVPGSLLIGSGQALIVSCFFRIGLSDVPVTQAGAGGAMLTTVQQAALGLGPALLGAVFAHRLHATGGDYLQAVLTALVAELCLMAVLVASAVRYRCR